MDMPGNLFKRMLQQRRLQIGLFVGLANAYSMDPRHRRLRLAADRRRACTQQSGERANAAAGGGDTSLLRTAALKLAASFRDGKD